MELYHLQRPARRLPRVPPGFKEDCPEHVDEEGKIAYTDPSFVEAFAEAMVERHAGMKQKGDIHDFTVKMRKRRVRLEKWAKYILKKKKVYYIELWRRHAAQARAANCVDDAATEATRLARATPRPRPRRRVRRSTSAPTPTPRPAPRSTARSHPTRTPRARARGPR